jgi:DNA invertase Pin-like site-specific DNA recombinase
VTLPAAILVTRERRGRPRLAVDVEIVDILLAHRLPTRRIAAALGVDHSTIVRRGQESRRRNLFRCPVCSALSVTTCCPNGHEINAGFLHQP